MFLLRTLRLLSGVAALVLVAPAVAQSTDHTPTVIQSSHHDVSAPMREIIRNMPPQQPLGSENEPFEIPNIFLKPHNAGGLGGQVQLKYPGIQKMPTGVPAPLVDLSFEGISATQSGCGCLPPDTEGDVSENEYIQWVNTSWAVFDKTTGEMTSGPTPGNSFWAGFGGKCQTTNSGDPLTVYDQRAHRWVMSQFVTSAPFAQCVAVSQTSDPLGAYDRYEFDWPNRFGDYGKLGVWTDDGGSQDAYLLTTHEFNGSGTTFYGAAYIAFDRDAMLAGAPTANMVRFPGFDSYGVEPFNLIGTLNAPANACPAFVHFDNATSNYQFWNMCLDWTTPANTTVSATPDLVQGNPFVEYTDEVPQQGSGAGLDPFGTHVMFHAQVRAFPPGAPTQMSLVINHAVQGDVQQAGINWVHFSLGNGGTPPPQPTALTKQIVDEGTYAPDANNRWLGGIAIDDSANIGVGYSLSSATSHPQVMVSGRSLSDPAGTLRDEQSCTDGIGNGSQTSSSNRWGDYSEMSVDPTDQCTFWYTNEYYPTTAGASWHTRVCTFKFAGCGSPDFAVVSDTPKRVEVCGATASGDPTWNLRVGVLNGFSGDVTLAGASLPPGASASFTPNPVSAPGQSLFTLTGGATLPSGEYAFSATGAGGSDRIFGDGFDGTALPPLPGMTRSVNLQLGVSATAAAAPALSLPADAAAGVLVRPNLVWAASDSALSYTVDVATDAAFTNIISTDTLTTTSWVVGVTLDASTTYYWRVTPHNYCGDGAVSTTYSFTTGVPGVCPAGTTTTVAYEDDFENGINGWNVGGTGAVLWTQVPAPAGTGMSTTVWQMPDNDTSSDGYLTSPVIAIPGNAQQVILSYDAYHSSETNDPSACWDLSSMEASTDGTTFNYLDGDHMLTDPYNGAGSNDTPVGSREGWCYPGPAGNAAPTHAIVNLDDFVGDNLQLRYRMTSDTNTAAPAPNGLIIDNFKVEVCQ